MCVVCACACFFFFPFFCFCIFLLLETIFCRFSTKKRSHPSNEHSDQTSKKKHDALRNATHKRTCTRTSRHTFARQSPATPFLKSFLFLFLFLFCLQVHHHTSRSRGWFVYRVSTEVGRREQRGRHSERLQTRFSLHDPRELLRILDLARVLLGDLVISHEL